MNEQIKELAQRMTNNNPQAAAALAQSLMVEAELHEKRMTPQAGCGITIRYNPYLDRLRMTQFGTE